MPLSIQAAATTTNIYAISDALGPLQTILALSVALALIAIGIFLITRDPSRTLPI